MSYYRPKTRKELLKKIYEIDICNLEYITEFDDNQGMIEFYKSKDMGYINRVYTAYYGDKAEYKRELKQI